MRSYLLASVIGLIGCGPQFGSHTSAGPRPASDTPAGLQVFTSDMSGFDTHSFWLDTGSAVVVFDAQFTEPLAQKLVANIQAQTSSPIRFVVVTHPNPDKFNGAGVFQRLGAQVVASSTTAAAIPGVYAYKKNYFVNVAHMFTADQYPPQATVDVTFDGDFDLPLDGDTQVHLHELSNPGVSSTQTVALIPSLSAVIVGDLVHHRAHAWLEGGIYDGVPRPDLDSWTAALDELLEYAPGTTVYGGRGETAPVEQAVPDEQQYLAAMRTLVQNYIDGLGDQKSELAGPNAGMHYQKLTELAQAAYPDYTLGYLIQYGVYGLVNELAGLSSPPASGTDSP